MLAGMLLLCSMPVVLIAQREPLPDGPGKAATVKLCSNCHGIEVSTGRRETREGWNAVVNDMIQRGAVGTGDEFGEVVDYLTANFSKTKPASSGQKPAPGASPKAADRKINVNDATAKDFAEVLGIPDKQAAAIVDYRKEHGKFKDLEDLAKVPGLEAAKIEANKGKLIF